MITKSLSEKRQQNQSRSKNDASALEVKVVGWVVRAEKGVSFTEAWLDVDRAAATT